jgi:hypothetical protein
VVGKTNRLVTQMWLCGPRMQWHGSKVLDVSLHTLCGMKAPQSIQVKVQAQLYHHCIKPRKRRACRRWQVNWRAKAKCSSATRDVATVHLRSPEDLVAGGVVRSGG